VVPHRAQLADELVELIHVVLRKHYGRCMTSAGLDQIGKMKSSERDGSMRDEQRAPAQLLKTGQTTSYG
jgi:hypothetical protein